MNFEFFLISILFGIALAMDAFSVSLANGLNEPNMKKPRMLGIAGVFAFFQALMPMIGWVCVHTILEYFSAFEKFIPYIALVILSLIGINMIYESVKNKDSEEEKKSVGFGALIIQGIATSIDALSVGLDIADYDITKALISVLIIAAVTFIICLSGILIGRKFGTKLASKAGIFGGSILIIIGVEIFVTSFLK